MNRDKVGSEKKFLLVFLYFLFLFTSLRVSGLKTMLKVHLNDFAL